LRRSLFQCRKIPEIRAKCPKTSDHKIKWLRLNLCQDRRGCRGNTQINRSLILTLKQVKLSRNWLRRNLRNKRQINSPQTRE
tara:strand:+ start:653 stop:898 length:246 start_codon:yes stop_codon:yes gene_type:complete